MPLVSKKAPGFSATALVDGDFKTVSLDDYKGKYVVLFFWPMDFTFVCPTEIIAFNDSAARFKESGAVVLGVSTDSEFVHNAWVQVPRKEGGLGPMSIPLIADTNHKISRAYDVLLEDEGVALRGVFIIGPDQTIRVAQVNDKPIGRNVEEVIRLLDATVFTDKHGEVCPANWQKGQAALDTKNPKAYFSKVNA